MGYNFLKMNSSMLFMIEAIERFREIEVALFTENFLNTKQCISAGTLQKAAYARHWVDNDTMLLNSPDLAQF